VGLEIVWSPCDFRKGFGDRKVGKLWIFRCVLGVYPVGVNVGEVGFGKYIFMYFVLYLFEVWFGW